MSETQTLLTDTAGRVLTDHCMRDSLEAAEAGTWPSTLWQALTDTGLAAAAIPEARGGADTGWDDLCTLARVAGYHAAPVPLIETWLAERMLAAADLQPIEGPLTVGPVLLRDTIHLQRRSGHWTVTGEVKRIPWARNAAAIVLALETDDGARTVVVRDVKTLVEACNYAREPRDTLQLDGHVVSDELVSAADCGLGKAELLFRGALLRTQQMAGAMERVLELTVTYAQERVQFGRVIGKYQAVQQQIASLASHVAAAGAAAQGAADANAVKLARFEIAAAKARIGEAVTVVAGVAHQVHAAMGFTHEHALHRSTRRLWAWRDEFGTESEWQAWVGHVAAQLGGAALWPYIVATNKPNLGPALP